jgi:hypothetical protein
MISTMRNKVDFFLIALAFLLIASPAWTQSPSPFVAVTPQTQVLLGPAITRFSKDEIKMDWKDLWEIDEQEVATKREFLLKDDAAPVSRDQYILLMNQAIEGGGVPIMTSFQLVKVIPQLDGFLVSACVAAKRESFHFKGIVEVTAHLRDGKVTFGSWSYKYSMPHSCKQKDDTE